METALTMLGVTDEECELLATHRHGNGSSSMHLQEKDLPEEGKPIDISKHFDKRWESYLKGVEIFPVDAPER